MMRRRHAITAFALTAIAALATARVSAGAQATEVSHSVSLDAWSRISTVLMHPRCLNCHQLDVPLQGDTRRLHVPLVARGHDNTGVTTMRCANCHNDSGNNETSATPGAPHWSLAPASMVWQGLASGDLCRRLTDRSLNGGRSAQALLEHMEKEPLVLYGWHPGNGRQPVPIPHAEFISLMRTWIAGGSACPT